METALCALGATRLARRRRVDQAIVLAYHNIVPAGERAVGDLSLHLEQREFARQLDLLGRTHDFVSLDELFTRGSRSRPCVVITFDDAYAGALRAGVEELHKRSIPATVFVPPAFINGGTFWWDALAAPDGAGIDQKLRDYALHRLAGKDADVRLWAASINVPSRSIPAHQTCASEIELAAAAATGLITFGSHSWSHRNLTNLEAVEIADEIARPLNWLQARFSAVVPWISYPYGLRNEAVETIAEKLQLRGGFLISRGWLAGQSTSRFALPRLNVPAGLSLRGLEILTSGLR